MAGKTYKELVQVIFQAKDELSGPVRKARGAVGDLNKQVGDGAKLFRQATNAAAGLAAAYVGFDVVRDAVKEVADFSKEVARINTIAKKSTYGLKEIKDEIREISTTTGQARRSVTASLYDIYSNLGETGENMELLADSAEAAVAGFVDMSVTGAALTGVMNAMNLSAEKSNEILDIQFKTIERGKTTYQELAQFSGNFLAAVKGASQEYSRAMGGFATLTKTLGDSAKASTALNMFFTRFADREFVRGMRDLNIEVVTAAGQFRDYDAVLAELNKKLSKMDEFSRAQTVKKLMPGEEARRALLSFINNFGVFGEDIKAVVEQFSGAMRAAADVVDATVGHELDQVREKWVDVKLELGEELAPELTDSVEGLGEALRYLSGSIIGVVGVLRLATAGLVGTAGAIQAVVTAGKKTGLLMWSMKQYEVGFKGMYRGGGIMGLDQTLDVEGVLAAADKTKEDREKELEKYRPQAEAAYNILKEAGWYSRPSEVSGAGMESLKKQIADPAWIEETKKQLKAARDKEFGEMFPDLAGFEIESLEQPAGAESADKEVSEALSKLNLKAAGEGEGSAVKKLSDEEMAEREKFLKQVERLNEQYRLRDAAGRIAHLEGMLEKARALGADTVGLEAAIAKEKEGIQERQLEKSQSFLGALREAHQAHLEKRREINDLIARATKGRYDYEKYLAKEEWKDKKREYGDLEALEIEYLEKIDEINAREREAEKRRRREREDVLMLGGDKFARQETSARREAEDLKEKWAGDAEVIADVEQWLSAELERIDADRLEARKAALGYWAQFSIAELERMLAAESTVEKDRVRIRREINRQLEEGDVSLAEARKRGFREMAASFRNAHQIMLDVGREMAESARQAWSDSFFSIFKGEVDNLGDVWRNFISDMRDAYLRALADMMAQRVMTKLGVGGEGVFDEGKSSGLGGGGFGSIIGAGLAFAGLFDEGGLMRGPGLAMVGPIEEAFVPTKAGKIPVEIQTPEAAGGTGSGGIVINQENSFVINANDAQSFQEYLAANGSGVIAGIAAEVAPGAVDRNIRNNGGMSRWFRS